MPSGWRRINIGADKQVFRLADVLGGEDLHAGFAGAERDFRIDQQIEHFFMVAGVGKIGLDAEPLADLVRRLFDALRPVIARRASHGHPPARR